MTDNMPILYTNIMDGLPSDMARDAFLWATERDEIDTMCYSAEKFARQVDQIASGTKPMFEFAIDQHADHGQNRNDTLNDLEKFMLKRHANWRYGGNQTPTYTESQNDIRPLNRPFL